MASSNIKLFDENKGNMLSDTEFNISTQRLNGLQTGVASSQLQNKAMYQASLMAYAIAQLMLANGQNANDTDAVSTFVNNLSASIVQKKLDKATKQDVEAGTVGKWISSELLKSNNEVIDAKKANVDDLTALAVSINAALGSGGYNCRIICGSYTGTGTYGSGNPNSLTTGFKPILVFVHSKVDIDSKHLNPGMLFFPLTVGKNNLDRWALTVSWRDDGVSWYTTDSGNATATIQMNTANQVYNYIAFGYSA